MSQPMNNQSGLFDFRPQAVENWANKLPRGSVGKTSELIYRALHQINEQTMKPGDRFRILESLRDSVHYVTVNMGKHIKGSYPLPEKIVLIASACQAIFSHMTDGYCSVFQELKQQNVIFVDKIMLNTSIHRSLRYLQQSLLLTYKTYTAFQHDYWERLHGLYKHAEENKLAQNTVIDEFFGPKRKTSIENVYIHTLLLYMAEPYHLRLGEIDEVNRQLEAWHHHTTLRNVKHHSELLEGERLIVIELDQNQPPIVASKILITSDIKECRIIDNTKLLIRLKTELEKIIADRKNTNTKINTRPISINLLHRLIESWSQTKKRLYLRNTLIEKINITVGMHQTHMQLLYEQHVDQISSRKDAYSGFYTKPEFESIEVKDVNAENSDIWSTIYAWTNTDVSNINAADDSQKKISDYRVKQENWTLLNESAEGFCIMSVEKNDVKIQVGEIVSLQRKSSPLRSIGVVRWIKAYGTNGIQLGGMLLAPSAISVSVSLAEKSKENQIVDRCLLLPLMKMLNRPDALLTFARQYQKGDVLQLSQANEEISYIKLNKVIADNGLVSQFTFIVLEKDNEIVRSDLEITQERLNCFNDIWDDL